MSAQRDPLLHRSERAQRILAALEAERGIPHPTEHYALAARCSIAEAVVELQRLEREFHGIIRGRNYAGMTWRWSS